MASKQEMYDTALLGILQNEGQLKPFLDAIFQFLFRRTDLFMLLDQEGKRGFPPGVARNIVLEVFSKYEKLALQRDGEINKQQAAQRQKKTVPPADNSSSVCSSSAGSKSNQPAESVQLSSQSQNSTEPASQSGNSVKANQSCQPPHPTQDNSKGRMDVNTAPSESLVPDGQLPNGKDATEPTSKDDDDPELTEKQRLYQSQSESYNGAQREDYSWTQTITDVDIHVKVPSAVQRGKQVKVDLSRKHLSTWLLEGGDWVPLVEGDFCWEINKEQSMWTLVPGECIHVSLQKVQERWWDSAFTTEPKISVRKIDASRPITDLDDEAQAKIEEMMWNEQRKRQGLPTSEQLKNYELLRKAWDADGSPFKGQPFDPSKVNLTSGSSSFPLPPGMN